MAGLGLSGVDAEDVLQDVRLAVLKQPPKTGEPAEQVGWLVRVTINCCLAEHRRRQRFRRSAERIYRDRQERQTSEEPPEQKLIRNEELEMIRESLMNMEDKLQTPLVLKYVDNLNASQIGQILQLNPSTVRSRLREARLLLAKKLQDKEIHP